MKRLMSVLFVGATIGALGLPAEVAGQFHVDMSPFVGGGQPAPSAGMLPVGGTALTLDTHTVLGLAVEAFYDGLPFVLRVSSSRTSGAQGFTWVGLERGPRSSSAVRHELGPASASTFWADIAVSPFSWNVAPYAFFGVGRRWISYDAPITGVARPEAISMQRYGLGLDMDFNFTRRSSLWIEGALQGGARVLGVGSHEVPEYLQVTAGVRLPAF